MEVLYQVLEVADKVIYVTLGITAMFGIFTVIMVTRRIAQKRFARPAQAEAFLEEVHDNLKSGNTEAVVELCDSPRYWSCLLYTSPSPRDATLSRMPSSA